VSLETDLLIDRRRLKRRVVVWRTLAVLALIGIILVALRGREGGIWFGGPYVARARVNGIIAGEDELATELRKLATDKAARALVVEIDSPGGGVNAGEVLHDAIAAVAARKPVVSVMGGIAASAGYMIAVPARRIFAREGTLTGSIGVYVQSFEVTGLLDKIGVTPEVFKSGPLKDEPSPFEKTSPEARQMLQGIVGDYYDQFVAMVAAGRHMDVEKVRALADGRPYTGRQAVALGLVDQLGDEQDARAWLASAAGVPTSLPWRDISRASLAARTFGDSLSTLVEQAWKSLLSQWLSLDGVWSLWQRPGE